MRVLRLALCLMIALTGGPLQAERQAFPPVETHTQAPVAGIELAQFRRGFGGYRAPVYRPPVYRPPPMRTIPRVPPPNMARPAPPRAPPPPISRSVPRAVPKIAAPRVVAPKTLAPPKIAAASPRVQPGRAAAPAMRPALRPPSAAATIPPAARGVPGTSAQRLAAGVRTGRTVRFAALPPRAGVSSAAVPRGSRAAPVSGRAANSTTLQASRLKAQRQKEARAQAQRQAMLATALSARSLLGAEGLRRHTKSLRGTLLAYSADRRPAARLSGGQAASMSLITISSNLATGRPSAIYSGFGDLSKRQSRLLSTLRAPGNSIVVNKGGVSHRDLAALTAKTGDEFAVFTTGGRRLVVRGTSRGFHGAIDEKWAIEKAKQGWRFSAHTHPIPRGVRSDAVLFSSDGDKKILRLFPNETSAIINSKGDYLIFDAGGDRN